MMETSEADPHAAALQERVSRILPAFQATYGARASLDVAKRAQAF
jgi:hypothetical protein